MSKKVKKTSGNNLVSRSEFARMAGVSPAAITKACQAGAFPVCEGGLIDANHNACQLYISEHAGAEADPHEVMAELTDINFDSGSVLICVKINQKKLTPVVAIEFSAGDEYATTETIFPQKMSNISISKKEGVITALQIGNKKYKPHCFKI